jgi:hypothetical protein
MFEQSNRKPGFMKQLLFARLLWHIASFVAAVSLGATACLAAETQSIDTPKLHFSISPETGRYELVDKQAGVAWNSNPFQPRFGEAAVIVGGNIRRVSLTRCQVEKVGADLMATFAPLAERPDAKLRVRVRPLADNRTLEFVCESDPMLGVESVRLLDDALWTTDADHGYIVVPVREGLLIPADSGSSFSHRFDTYAYEGCHMTMLGVVKQGAAALVTWTDPYVAADVRSTVTNAVGVNARQVLSASLTLRKSATAFQLHLLGRGDYVDIAKAYRRVARQTGWWVPWTEKFKGHPDRAKYFGASNFKLWSTLSRSMNEDSTKELSVKVNWTFDQAAQVAEHLKRDLQLDKVLFIMGGWIHRGYDNQHPDILPTAPECGGDVAFSNACCRIRALGYLLSLHDNYQDIYRDAPSWNEDYVNKNPDGSLTKGGHWAGGMAYITCAQKALELAERPQNLVAVKALSDANSYFIDTTYAAGLYECYDKNHPMTRADDLKWKQALSDYARGVFGSFGSECGREWAIPHADFFEGLSGVSGNYYHNQDLLKQLGATPVPLFEMVYRDCIQIYGKYGYDPAQAAEYVLHHISIGRPLNYHSIPEGLYWKTEPRENTPLALRPSVAEIKQTGPRQFSISYRWQVDKTPADDWRVFVHFCDEANDIKFQNDYVPPEPTSNWSTGELRHGPFIVTLPDNLSGAFNVRLGLFQLAGGQRARLTAKQDDDRTVLAGRLTVRDGRIEFVAAPSLPAVEKDDAAVFTRADGGWAEGMHPLDHFVKNTHEILSPLNELTSQLPMTQHQFLTPDRTVRRSVFGEGSTAVEVVVNMGAANYRQRTKSFGEVLLPPNGFVIEASTFAAFHALSWNGLTYDSAPLFTLRSLDGKPINDSKRVHVFHGFGDSRLKLGNQVQSVPREGVF